MAARTEQRRRGSNYYICGLLGGKIEQLNLDTWGLLCLNLQALLKFTTNLGHILIRVMTVSLQALQATVVIKLITAHMKTEREARRCAIPPIHSVGVHFAYILSSRLERPHCYLLRCGSLTVRTMIPLMSTCIAVPVTGACVSCGSGVKVPLE